MPTLTLPVEETKKSIEQEALITGAEAIAIACRLANVDVVTAYPIRPYDTVMQYIEPAGGRWRNGLRIYLSWRKASILNSRS